MMNNIILNGVNSNTIQGLIIQELPPISKPAIRTEIEEIDGRDGDVITKLGYAAYDKQLSIGLYGNYDINQVISFFNTSGTVIFSNEPDKYYNYQILNEIDFERLVRFRTAIVTMHVQPFKYSATETPQELSGTVITGEGTNINLVNTTDSGLFTDLQKKGDTFQQTYSGNNLFDKDNVMVGYRIGGNGLPYATTGYNLSDFIPVQPDTTYTRNFINTGNSTTAYYGTNKNFIERIGNTNTGTFTTTGETYYIRTAISDENLNSLMINEGSTALPYEPYVGGTPSPNPNYPQEVKTVSGNNSIVICGKNLLDVSQTIQGGYNDSTFLPTNTNYITVQYIPVKPNTNYTLSSLGLDLTKYAALRVVDFDISKTFIRRNSAITMNQSTTSVTFTTNNDTYYIALCFYTSQTASVNDLTQGQLEQGSTATDYEAYTSQTYPINLGNIELCEINGSYDYIYKNNGTWYLHEEIGKVVLNGSETGWFKSSNTSSTNFVGALDGTNMTNLFNCPQGANQTTKSNYFMNTNNLKTTSGFLFYNLTSGIYKSLGLSLPINDVPDLATFKTWLGTHNTKMYYPLATSTDTEITDSTLLSQLNALGNATTYLGTTNINTSGDGLSPILYVETVAVDDPVLKITNSGNTIAKPIMTLYGTGTINLSLNGEQIFVIDLSSENYITIDVANMEAYYNGILKNRLVTGNYENFVLNQGENEITFTGTLYSLTISNYSRWI